MISNRLKDKINCIQDTISRIYLGSIHFSSPLILAPMAGICNIPFRRLMQDLGAGGTVSELVSCHGINHGNQRTLDMLKIHPSEQTVGLQLFGEDPDAMASATRVALEYKPKFIDINMGCPVRKVVNKGGGSALMKNPEELKVLFQKMKSVMNIPLSIKIRTGWDSDGKNAEEIIHIAKQAGVEWVAIHGRTRAQQYTGNADWDYIEKLANNSPLPIVGNGDLHTPSLVSEKLQNTQCQALMLARGALRWPFIFLESFDHQYLEKGLSRFDHQDYAEICAILSQYVDECFDQDRVKLNQFRKLVVWFSSGFSGAAKFRQLMFTTQQFSQAIALAQDYYQSLQNQKKMIDQSESFMTSGHG